MENFAALGLRFGTVESKLHVPYGNNGAISSDGKWLAYTPYNADYRTWKRYRGGMAPDVWLFNLESRESKKITDFEGTDTIPIWNDSKVYYLSDAVPVDGMDVVIEPREEWANVFNESWRVQRDFFLRPQHARSGLARY